MPAMADKWLVRVHCSHGFDLRFMAELNDYTDAWLLYIAPLLLYITA